MAIEDITVYYQMVQYVPYGTYVRTYYVHVYNIISKTTEKQLEIQALRYTCTYVRTYVYVRT